MTSPQIVILAILAATIGMFLWGRWRHDMVAMASLLACVTAGLVSPKDAFTGFGHPAVVTVACVLILGRALQSTGAVDVLGRLLPSSSGPVGSIAAISGMAAVLSAFMNNVGALALLMPLGIQMAGKHNIPPGRVLMPLAFGSILGGMVTLIGTPPNLIVSGFREHAAGVPFGMFDFTPVGLAVAAAGLVFMALAGWRLVPVRQRADAESFTTGAYITEARVKPGSKAIGQTLRQLGPALEEADAQVIALVRNDLRMTVPHAGRRLREGDILVLEAEPESLATAPAALGLQLVEDVPAGQGDDGDAALIEITIPPDSDLVGKTASEIHLRTRYGINLLALSRKGKHRVQRLRSTPFHAGDVLLLQGAPEAITGFAGERGCVPLAPRDIRIPDKGRALWATAIMALAVAAAALGLMSAAASFAAGVLAVMALRVISPKAVYTAVDWPVIVLLGALIPVAGAIESTGAARLIARFLLDSLAGGNAITGLALVLVVTMTLSDFMNNAATAAVMCPIAISTAGQLQVKPDAFLMAVAVGASCAFLTPIGHQNNTLILGPGGFRFGDYWRLGLPLEILVVVVGLPLLLLVWPL